jgi:hypothetical protein
MRNTRLIASLMLASLAVAMPALAGPPFVCHVFDIGAAKSLPWGAVNNFMGMRDDYDLHRVVGDTEQLLTPSTPTLVRMETLRRAALYASRDRAVADQLLASMMGRVRAADQAGHPDALALFDAGYVVEALSELEQFGIHMKAFAGLERVLAGVTYSYEARPLLERSAALRPDDASIQFALGLMSRAPENEARFKKARTAAREDALLASNLARLQLQ